MTSTPAAQAFDDESGRVTTSAADRALRAAHDERFYARGTPVVPALVQELLTQYSGIPAHEVAAHVEALVRRARRPWPLRVGAALTSPQRDRAYAVQPYPCIGRYRFLTFSLAAHPLFQRHVLPTLLASALAIDFAGDSLSGGSAALPAPSPSPTEPVLLDIGTCLGQDLRLLLHRGVPPTRLFGTDVEPAFFDLGYELFGDAATFPRAHQLAPVNVFSDEAFGPADGAEPPFAPAGLLAPFAARVNILHISAVFHLFSYNDQVEVGRRILSLMCPPRADAPAAVILGCQTAHAMGKEYPQRINGRGEGLFRHSAATWEAMWKDRIAPGSLVTFADGRKAVLRLVTELDAASGNLPGLQGAVNDRGDERADPHFKWMKFEVWIDPLR